MFHNNIYRLNADKYTNVSPSFMLIRYIPIKTYLAGIVQNYNFYRDITDIFIIVNPNNIDIY